MRRNIQMVFQDPYTSLNPRMTVGDIIGEPFEIHPEVAPKGDRRKAVQDLLDVVGLNPEYINRYPHQFSGGQRQRIGIARGLALKPEIIICDEPVSALDVSVQAQVINLLEQLQHEFDLSYIFIAHDLSIVRHISGPGRRDVPRQDGRDRQRPGDLRPRRPTRTPRRCSRPSRCRTRRRASAADRIVLTGDVPSPANPPSGCRFRTRCWKAQDRCATEVPLLAVAGLAGRARRARVGVSLRGGARDRASAAEREPSSRRSARRRSAAEPETGQGPAARQWGRRARQGTEP